LQRVLEKIRKNPAPALAACIKELEADLEQEYEHRARTEAEYQERLKGAHDQLEAHGEEQGSLFDQNKKLAAKLKGTCCRLCPLFWLSYVADA
jgi:hypothetical protein